MTPVALSGYRLSPRQRRLWRSDCASREYQVQCAVAVRAEAEEEQMRAAFERIVKREQLFHSVFCHFPGMAVPILTPEPGMPARWQVINDDAAAEALLLREREYALDFARGPLLRACLVCRNDGSRVFILSAPSLCADAATLSLLTQEIAGGTRKDSISYVLFSEWLNETTESEDGRQAAEHWNGWKPNCPAATVTAFDLPGEAGEFTPRFRALAGDNETVRRLGQVAAELEVSREAILLACWRILLGRLILGPAASVGVILPGRDHESLAATVGPIACCAPVDGIQDDVSPEVSFARIARETEDRMQDCRDWGIYFTPAELDGFSFSWEVWSEPDGLVARYGVMERFKLQLSATAIGEALNIELGYDASRISSEGADCVACTLEAILGSALEQPQRELRDLNLLDPQSRNQLLLRSCGPVQAVPEGTLHSLFEAQGQRSPDQIAVADEFAQLSYSELDAAANSVADTLRPYLGPEELVGLLAERSVETISALIGILKSGAAYLPLDPSQPAERLHALCAAAGVRFIWSSSGLAQAAGATGLPAISQILPASALAYAIYTSGSSGQPKAVAIEHSSAVNLVEALDQRVYTDLGGPLRVALNAPLTFDASVKQWLRLLRGDTLLLVPEEVRYDPQMMISWLQRRRVEVLDCTPAQLEGLVDAGMLAAHAPDLKAVLVGGEPISAALWKSLAGCRTIRFHNLYGPTECTVDASEAGVVPESHRPVIGCPLANVQMYVLDRDFEPVAGGIAGELFIGGRGVARGYWKSPELTAERFLPNQFDPSEGSRLYRTGDRARWLPDGSIEYLGRLDRQVKIRGYRVEPREIESVLLEHAGIQAASVTAGNGVFAAYLVRVPGAAALEMSELRRLLRSRLPEFMVPATLAELTHLPLTPNGKVDYAALPALARPVDRSPQTITPRNQLERSIAAIWAEVLGREAVGIEDNFFDVGGHSLLLARLYTRLRENLSREFAMIELFRNPTVCSFAAFLTREAGPIESPDPLLDRAARQKRAIEERERARRQEA